MYKENIFMIAHFILFLFFSLIFVAYFFARRNFTLSFRAESRVLRARGRLCQNVKHAMRRGERNYYLDIKSKCVESSNNNRQKEKRSEGNSQQKKLQPTLRSRNRSAQNNNSSNLTSFLNGSLNILCFACVAVVFVLFASWTISLLSLSHFYSKWI